MRNQDLRRRIVEVAYKSQAGHIPSSLSCVDLVWWTFQVMKEQDRFILSKGHASLALYAVLEKKGLITPEALDRFGPGGLPGHPDRFLNKDIELSTGSLGHGLAFAAGLAMGIQKKFKAGCYVYVLLGDGECQEGSVWEAARIIGKYDLPVIAIVDHNASHESSSLMIAGMFTASGWRVRINPLACMVENSPIMPGNPPFVWIVNTKKGDGVKRMEESPSAWHHRAPSTQEYYEIMQELA